MDEQLIALGSEIKALGDNRFGGYVVVFGDPTKTDLTGDYFTADTDYGVDWDSEAKATVYFNHGYDPVMKKRKLGRADLRIDNAGVWGEVILQERDEYEKMLVQLAQKNVFGWSSGSAPHLVEREAVGGAMFIKSWPIVEASITHTPAEWRTQVMSLKSIEGQFLSLVDSNASAEPEVQPEASIDAVERQSAKAADIRFSGEEKMAENAQTPPVETDEVKALKAANAALSERMDKVLKYMEDSPALKNAGFFTVDGGTADTAIKSVPDMLLAIKRGDNDRCVKHYGLKAQVGDSGVVGGYFVPDSVIQDLMPSLSLVSPLGQMVRRIPVSTPSGTAPIRDYSRVPTANVGDSASAAGIASQGRAEGGAYTEETMYFEMLRWNVGDYASGYVKMSRELSQDAPMVQAMLEEGIREDVANKEEYAILRGNGVNKPLGVLNWSGRIEIDEDTDNTFVLKDADEMISRLLKRTGARLAWVHHPGAYTDIADFEVGTGGAVLSNDLSRPVTNLLRGYPRYDSQHLPAQGSDGYVILGDWASYILFDYKGLYIEFSEHADFLNGNNVWRFGKRQDGMPAMTGPVTLADGSFTLSPFVILANKT